ncbi:hypothetical protein GCM10020255_095620 [Rhodococcus baikonurensis]
MEERRHLGMPGEFAVVDRVRVALADEEVAEAEESAVEEGSLIDHGSAGSGRLDGGQGGGCQACARVFRSRHDDHAVSVLIDELLKLFALVGVAEARRPLEHRIRLGLLG